MSNISFLHPSESKKRGWYSLGNIAGSEDTSLFGVNIASKGEVVFFLIVHWFFALTLIDFCNTNSPSFFRSHQIWLKIHSVPHIFCWRLSWVHFKIYNPCENRGSNLKVSSFGLVLPTKQQSDLVQSVLHLHSWPDTKGSRYPKTISSKSCVLE